MKSKLFGVAVLVLSFFSFAQAWQTVNGVAICTAAGDQVSYGGFSDGTSGAIIAWFDYRSDTTGLDLQGNIYAQRMNLTGSPLWANNGIAVCTVAKIPLENQITPMGTSDGAGGAIITWADGRNGTTNLNIYAQRVDSNGNILWTANGVAICTAAYNQRNPMIVSDGSGGGIIAWWDYRNEAGYTETTGSIYIQRVNSTGSTLWTINGVQVCTTGCINHQPFPVRFTSDGSGGCILTWEDYRNGNFDIYAQRVDSTGSTLWGTNGLPICINVARQQSPSIASDGSGGAIINWNDDRNGASWHHLYAQRVNSSGTVLWTTNGVPINAIGSVRDPAELTNDSSGNVIITWADARNGTSYEYLDLYAQRVDSNGNALWTANGVAICTAVNEQYEPRIVSDGLGGAIITWKDYRNTTGNPGVGLDVYAQRVNSTGTILWTLNGVAVCTAANDQNLPWIASAESGNYIISWIDYRNGTDYDIYAQSINSSGFVILPPQLSGAVFYNDINSNGSVDAGDTLVMQFAQRMQVNGATTTDFYLPVTGNNLGTAATVSINTANDTQVVITLGSLPSLTIPGIFSMSNTTSGSPSGIDISATMTPNAIEDIYGTDAQDGGIPGINDSGQDIRYTVLGTSTTVSANSSAIIQVSQDTLNVYYTGHKLVIPTNSLTTGATITIGAPGDNHGELSAVSLNPPQVTFSSSTPATIVLEYKDADTKLDAGYMETAMRIQQWKNVTTGWVLIPETYGNQSVDLILKTVSVNINKFNMIGSNTTIVYANIALPTVGATSTVVAPAPSGLLKSFSPRTTITLSVTTSGIYTKHKLVLTDYTTSYSGTTAILTQATLPEMHDWQNYAVLKIVTFGEITTQAMLTMEYKDHDDANNQFKNDIIGGAEYQMRIYQWLPNFNIWFQVPKVQTVNQNNNTVAATLDSLSGTQIFAVGVDPTAIPTSIDNSWEWYH